VTERLSAQVVVVGAGPAGIAAAITAAEAGADTLLLDENPAAGGQIWRAGVKGTPAPARCWVARLQGSGARSESGASVFDARGERTLLVERHGEPLAVSWDRLVLATGTRELFLPFPGWTLPNVMGIGGAQAMVKSGAQVSGMRVVVAGSGPLMLPVAATLAKAGAKLELVAEQAPGAKVRRFGLGLWRQPGKWFEAARMRLAFSSTRFQTGAWVESAEGDETVRAVNLTDGERTWRVECDLLATSYGLIPNAGRCHRRPTTADHVSRHLRGRGALWRGRRRPRSRRGLAGRHGRGRKSGPEGARFPARQPAPLR
jgi:NADPH-dependent 2,4-dienoyl-CoA reductase/sulfur reductase-like enzyme